EAAARSPACSTSTSPSTPAPAPGRNSSTPSSPASPATVNSFNQQMNPTPQSKTIPPALAELMRTLGTLAQAHRDLAEILEAQHAAMRSFDAGAMQQAARRQEAIHRR